MPIKSLIRTVPHYPKPGVMFRDITTLLKDPAGFRATINELVSHYTAAKIDKIAAIEARGFIVGAALALPEWESRKLRSSTPSWPRAMSSL